MLVGAKIGAKVRLFWRIRTPLSRCFSSKSVRCQSKHGSRAFGLRAPCAYPFPHSPSGPSLLDKDLMALLGTPAPATQSFNYAPRQQQQQQQLGAHGTSSSSLGNGGSFGGGVMPRGGGGTGSPRSGSSFSSVPLLSRPAGDTPSYPRSTYRGNIGGASFQQQPQAVAPGAMVSLGGGGGGRGHMDGTQAFGAGAMVPRAGNGGPGVSTWDLFCLVDFDVSFVSLLGMDHFDVRDKKAIVFRLCLPSVPRNRQACSYQVYQVTWKFRSIPFRLLTRLPCLGCLAVWLFGSLLRRWGG